MVSKMKLQDQSHVMVSLVSGDIAFRFLNHVKNKSPRSRQRVATADAHVTVCDINKAMLDVGQQRAARFNRSSGAHTGYLDVFSFECFTGSKRIFLMLYIHTYIYVHILHLSSKFTE